MTAARKPAARKPVARKPAARKPVARKPAARKPAARRPAARSSQPRLADSRKRLASGMIVLVAVLSVLAGRLVQLQGFESTAYAADAEKQRLRRIELRAERGLIVDRDLSPLAMNVELRTVLADPSLVKDPALTARVLATYLSRDAASLEDDLRKPGRYVVLARGVALDRAKAILELDPGLPGIFTEVESRRVYPNSALGASVVGFVGRDGDGLGGIEYALDKSLTGKSGEVVVERDLAGRQIPSGERQERAPVPGTTQVLTIDRDIQWMAEKTLQDQVAATRASGGTVIVMSVKTGEILALATTPTFDPNDLKTKGPRGNPAVSNVYEPGSVNKVIVAAAALETGLVTPTTPVLITPTIKVADKTFKDDHSVGTRHMSFTGVLAKSSNVGTIRVSQELGRERLHEFLRKFGFGSKTGVKFPGESNGLLARPEDWSGSQAGTIPIGQGVSATALQIANVYATVANGGVRLTPSLVRGSLSADGALVPAAAGPRTRVVSAKTAKQVSLMLEAVTTEGGTATRAAIPGYRVAGKTGTARKVRADGRGYAGYISSFVGFAPADAPELVVSVSLDDPVPIYGGIVAAPVFRTVMGFALGALRIPPTGRPPPPPVPLVLD
jgi:cell division protein FtsI (penicillin-binding protein 3)